MGKKYERKIERKLPFRLEVLVEHKILSKESASRLLKMLHSSDIELEDLAITQIYSLWDKYYLKDDELIKGTESTLPEEPNKA
jgi:hypothetical protein